MESVDGGPAAMITPSITITQDPSDGGVSYTKTRQSTDKLDIEMEEREQMRNAENVLKNEQAAVDGGNGSNEKQQTPEASSLPHVAAGDSIKANSNHSKDGMEVKPKKIPIGGIQMPGFFTRSKSKEKCKEDESGKVDDLDAEQCAASNPVTDLMQRIKLPQLFRKNKSEQDETTTDIEKGDERNTVHEKKKLLDSLRSSLAAALSRARYESAKEDQQQPPQPSSTDRQNVAGLASMETLDEKDDMKTINLDDSKFTEKLEAEEFAMMEGIWLPKLKPNKTVIFTACGFMVIIFALILAFRYSNSSMITVAPIRDGCYVEAVTQCGPVEGLIDDTSVAFRGIPYARPPVDELRFMEAQPIDSIHYCWNRTLLAHNATPVCLQIHSNGTLEGQEDCLTLDIVTPVVRYDNLLPVVVLIGADSLMGGSPGKMRPSARYAHCRDVVFVRPNFRLGALGFLAVKELSDDHYPHTSGNYGLSDILQALKWIQLNIINFGGDPNEVVVFGHKAGASLVTALATMPRAKHYMKRIWVTGGSAVFPHKTLPEAEKENESFMKLVDCTNVTCLRQLSAEKIQTAVQDTWRKPPYDVPHANEESNTHRHQWLVIDGVILREHPAQVWTNDKLEVSIVIGSTAHAAASDYLLLKHINWTEATVQEHIEQSLLGVKNLTSAVYNKYPMTYKGLVSLISDIRVVCPLFAISTQMNRSQFYVVTLGRGEYDLADDDSDVDAIMGRYEPKTAEQRRYVSAIQNYFYYYIYHGKLSEGADQTDAFRGRPVHIVDQDVLLNATYSHCAFWINQNIVLPYAALN